MAHFHNVSTNVELRAILSYTMRPNPSSKNRTPKLVWPLGVRGCRGRVWLSCGIRSQPRSQFRPPHYVGLSIKLGSPALWSLHRPVLLSPQAVCGGHDQGRRPAAVRGSWSSPIWREGQLQGSAKMERAGLGKAAVKCPRGPHTCAPVPGTARAHRLGQRPCGSADPQCLSTDPPPLSRQVLELLKVAWKRRLIFTVGTSNTTGETDTVVWNEIHHKTEMDRNVTGHGYPDPNYLQNVLAELAAQGVTEDCLEQQ